jgi:hypothetical protein
VATKGQAYRIEGRNPDGTWYLIRLSEKVTCWISASTGNPSGDTSGVRVIKPVPTPIWTLSLENACGQFTTPQTCAQHPECRWNRLATPAICQAK